MSSNATPSDGPFDGPINEEVAAASIPPDAAGKRTADIRRVKVGRHDVRVAIWPGDRSRTPLLIFNGIGARLELLSSFAESLGDDIETIIFDIPGTGETSPPFMPYRLWMLAYFTGKLLDTLGYERVDVMGISWGGTIAQQFALQYPGRCRRLVLAATTQGMLMIPGDPSVLMEMATPRRYNDPAHQKSIFGKMYGGEARTDSSLKEKVGPLMRPASRLGYLFQQMALMGWTSLPWLPVLRQPTLVLAGDDDPLVPLANAKLINRMIPNSKLHVLHDGHLFLISHEKECVSVVRDFLGSA